MLLYHPQKLEESLQKLPPDLVVLTADQWKNWACYYSPFALKGILPKENYDTWMHFVTACHLICCQSVTMEQCLEAESRILKFCKLFENLYGTEKCAPNMHLSCHLVECIRDYDQSTHSGVSPLRDTMASWGHTTRTIITLVSYHIFV